MKQGREFSKKLIVLAFLVATFVFLSGFLLSYMVTYSKYQSVSASQEEIRYQLLSLELEKELMGDSCEYFDPYYFSTELDKMGSLVGLLEKRFGKYDSKVLKQKEIYSMLEIQHFLLIKENNLQCNNIPTILFFYSNSEDFIDEAEKIGYILSNFKNKNNNNIMIYSFDYNLNINLIKMLKTKYKITSPNEIIINEEILIKNLNNIDELKNVL